MQESFDRTDWDEDAEMPAAVDVVDSARRFVHQQAKVWAGWHPNEFDGDSAGLAEHLRQGWERYVAENGAPSAGVDFLGAGMRRWGAERRRVEGLLARCLTPAVRPSDADRRPVVDVPTTLSYSMLSSYQACSRKAYLRFLAGFPGEPRPGATGPGTAFHAAVEMGAAAQQSGRELTFDGLLDAYREAAAEAHGVTLYTVTETERAMLQSFWDSPARVATALYVEAEFYWRVGPGYLHGFIDRIQRCPDGTIELIDFKTSRQALSEAQARQSLQILIYALATREVYGLPLDRLTLVYPRLSKRISVSFSDEELRAARLQIVHLMERARTASYDQVDTTHCPVCEYRLICPAATKLR